MDAIMEFIFRVLMSDKRTAIKIPFEIQPTNLFNTSLSSRLFRRSMPYMDTVFYAIT